MRENLAPRARRSVWTLPMSRVSARAPSLSSKQARRQEDEQIALLMVGRVRYNRIVHVLSSRS
jgi:hypothetical protein